ncbi:MAG: hypothetical protein CMB99_14485 [Flavobacteriaceae bacterium]|nr:hypothetical protein [Flavobacteriaceae bacterium]|tara:strand:- start:194017 stop:195201 length:1185 start_codon:yes stop_codon:yes gene_type:complete
MKKFIVPFLIVFFFFSGHKTTGQVQLSVYSEISIITTDSGDNLYETFGHSALRLKDPVLNLDLVYNYGVFDFNAPNFYGNFVQGRLLYKLTRYNFSYFLNSYTKQKRWIKQQTLNLTQQERQAFFMFLERNAQPQNAAYLYDPFFDNCASKLIDITQEILKDQITFHVEDMEKDLSLRTLMNREIHWNTWGSFGINLALGKKLDQKRQPLEYRYLPDYTHDLFQSATITRNGTQEPLVKKETVLASFPPLEKSGDLISPLLVFGLIFIVVLFLTIKAKKYTSVLKIIDFSLLLITGIVGLVILYLWMFTDHSTTPKNFNILWAFPLNLIVAFLFTKEKHQKWLPSYFRALKNAMVIQIFFWVMGWQVFSWALIPILLTLSLRYSYLQKTIFYPN